MRLKQESEEKTVLVQIKTKQRDNRQKVAEVNEATGKETGRQIDNPRYGKFYYEAAENGSFELEQTTPSEVREVIMRALAAASKK